MADVGKCERIIKSLLFLILLFSPQILSVGGDGVRHGSRDLQEKPFVTKMMSDGISLLKKSHQNYWDKVKTIIHDIQLQFFPPNLDFRSADGGRSGSGNGVTDKMKKAVEKSFVGSEQTAVGSAESAAKMVGDAMQKAEDKVKKSLSDRNDQETRNEL